MYTFIVRNALVVPPKLSSSAQLYCSRCEGQPREQSMKVSGLIFRMLSSRTRSLDRGVLLPHWVPVACFGSDVIPWKNRRFPAIRHFGYLPLHLSSLSWNVNARCIPAGRSVSRTFVCINSGTSYVVLNDFRITRVSYELSHGLVVMYDNITTGYRVCVSCYCRRARRRGRYYNSVPP